MNAHNCMPKTWLQLRIVFSYEHSKNQSFDDTVFEVDFLWLQLTMDDPSVSSLWIWVDPHLQRNLYIYIWRIVHIPHKYQQHPHDQRGFGSSLWRKKILAFNHLDSWVSLISDSNDAPPKNSEQVIAINIHLNEETESNKLWETKPIINRLDINYATPKKWLFSVQWN